jgi:hypothetical protein
MSPDEKAPKITYFREASLESGASRVYPVSTYDERDESSRARYIMRRLFAPAMSTMPRVSATRRA